MPFSAASSTLVVLRLLLLGLFGVSNGTKQTMIVTKMFDRIQKILREEGIIGLYTSIGAHLHNKFIFKYRIGFRSWFYTQLGHEGLERPFEPIRVDPNAITNVSKIEFNQKKKLGAIESGSWDIETQQVNEHPTYNGIKQRFQEGLDWEKTEYYNRSIERIQRGERMYGYSSVPKFEERLHYLDDLYHDIQDNEYRSQRDLVDDDWDLNRHPIVTPAHRLTGEIGINIGRSGELLHNDGMHRLSIAKMLDLDEVPVQVIVRHEEWQRQRNEILSSEVKTTPSKSIASHPDVTQFVSQ